MQVYIITDIDADSRASTRVCLMIGGFAQDSARRAGLGSVERIEGTGSVEFTFKGAGHRGRARDFAALLAAPFASGAAAVRGLNRVYMSMTGQERYGAGMLGFCDDLLALDDAAD